jgi:hypothetical protein
MAKTRAFEEAYPNTTKIIQFWVLLRSIVAYPEPLTWVECLDVCSNLPQARDLTNTETSGIMVGAYGDVMAYLLTENEMEYFRLREILS